VIVYGFGFSISAILATGVPGKPGFGLLGWNTGDFGNAPDPRSSA